MDLVFFILVSQGFCIDFGIMSKGTQQKVGAT